MATWLEHRIISRPACARRRQFREIEIPSVAVDASNMVQAYVERMRDPGQVLVGHGRIRLTTQGVSDGEQEEVERRPGANRRGDVLAAEVVIDAGSKAIHAVGDMMPTGTPKKGPKASKAKARKRRPDRRKPHRNQPKASKPPEKVEAKTKTAAPKAAVKKTTPTKIHEAGGEGYSIGEGEAASGKKG